jgi:hypothetical protein
MPETCQGEIDDALRQASDIHQFSGQQEEWDGQKLKIVGTDDHVLSHDLAIEIAEPEHERESTDDQREGDRHAECHGSEKRGEKDENCHSSRSLRAWASSPL